jgi:D-beta-D-heptose 7-phosphate kinase / D-beta-D-heptose 1-phosphate adenosyltransferase
VSAEPLVVVGDSLLDRDVDGRVERLSPDAPVPVLDEGQAVSRPGGAALAATLAARDGRPVVLVTALARDAAGLELGALLVAHGVEVVDLGLEGPTAEKIRFRSDGRPLMRLDRGGRATPGDATASAIEAIAAAGAVLVSDYGRGVTAGGRVRAALAECAAEAPVVWDPHPLGAAPVPGMLVVTPNESEARALAPGHGAGATGAGATSAGAARNGGAAAGAADGGSTGAARNGGAAAGAADGGRTGAADGGRNGGAGSARSALASRRARTGLAQAADLASALRAVWGAASVCVTRGADGALLVRGDGAPMAAPAPHAHSGDACGAGDRFASSLVIALERGLGLEEAVVAAVARASAFVSAGGAEAELRTEARTGAGPPTALDTVERVRAQGGTVVATGGCFDLLHAGHVRTLEAARSLGDCLVVCLNSDDSARRLKGPSRPVVSQEDRASVLSALACVDAVVVFGENTPERVLTQVRPHVWAKGGDYDGQALPEERALREWGGRAVILPYVEGRSTTRLIEEAACRG